MNHMKRPDMIGNKFAVGNKPNQTSFKKGQKPWNFIEGKVSYNTLHKWLIANKPRPPKCEHCGVLGAFAGKKQKHWNLQWANKDHSYNRILEDYIGLCTSCHNKFDVKHNGRVNRNQWALVADSVTNKSHS